MKVGDKVIVPGQMTGVVVCDIDNGEYSDENPAAHWAYLKTGIVVDTEEAGRIHYPDARDVTKKFQYRAATRPRGDTKRANKTVALKPSKRYQGVRREKKPASLSNSRRFPALV